MLRTAFGGRDGDGSFSQAVLQDPHLASHMDSRIHDIPERTYTRTADDRQLASVKRATEIQDNSLLVGS